MPLALAVAAIEYAYRKVGRDPYEDPWGMEHWIAELAHVGTTGAPAVVDQAEALLYVRAVGR